jgi:MFS family permease
MMYKKGWYSNPFLLEFRDMSTRSAMCFIVLFGLVSLFSDMTYEGARAIQGAFLETLGASAFMVGVLAGLSEFIGYLIRYFAGRTASHSGRYWNFIFVGYLLNLISIPILGWIHSWIWAFVFIFLERIGKALRVPSRDTLLSQAGQCVGMGWGFGIHEAMDRIGAMLGPLLVTYVIYQSNDMHLAFKSLWIPALLTLAILLLAFMSSPLSYKKIVSHESNLTLEHDHRFKIYVLGSSFMAMGFADFALMAFHFQKTQLVITVWIPIFYAISSAANILITPIWGCFFDKWGFKVLVVSSSFSIVYALCVFLGDLRFAFLGVILWGIGMGVQSSLMRAYVGKITAEDKRAHAYGIFNASFGLAWFIGSIVMGGLYEMSLSALVLFSFVCQLLGLCCYIFLSL